MLKKKKKKCDLKRYSSQTDIHTHKPQNFGKNPHSRYLANTLKIALVAVKQNPGSYHKK